MKILAYVYINSSNKTSHASDLQALSFPSFASCQSGLPETKGQLRLPQSLQLKNHGAPTHGLIKVC